MKANKVLRHTLTERIIHWTVALSGLTLLFSGFGQLPMYKRYYITSIPGLTWAGNFETTLVMHYIAAAFFSAAAVFHVVYHLRRKEYAAMPKKGDFKESYHIIKAIIKGKEEPPHEKFLAEQRLAYVAIAVVTGLLIITGLIKVYKNFAGVIPDDSLFLTFVTLTHTFLTPIFLFLVIAHLAAFLIKANRPMIISMVTGWIGKDYAENRHPLWEYPGKSLTEAEAQRIKENYEAKLERYTLTKGKFTMTLKKSIRLIAGLIVITSVSLGYFISPYWFLITAFVGANLIQSSFTGFCPAENIINKLFFQKS